MACLDGVAAPAVLTFPNAGADIQAHAHIHAKAHGTHLTPAAEAQRQALLAAAREALRRGDSQFASAQLDLAASMSHAADTESLQLQAQLQRGEFRQAMACAAHSAMAHADEPATLALYVWLLALTEQTAYAMRLLEAGLARLPGEPRLQSLRADLDRWQDSAAVLTSGARPQPFASGVSGAPAPPPGARQLGSGVLLEDGSTAIVPSVALGGRTRFWVRNGLGQTRQATPVPSGPQLQSLGLSLLHLNEPLPAPALARAPRDAFAGSPAAALSLLLSDTADPAWPALRTGFLGRVASQGQALGFDLPHASSGGPVLDNGGRLIGIAVIPAATGTQLAPQIVPLSGLLASGEAALNKVPVAAQGPRLEPDQLYERALLFTLQLVGS